MFGHQDDKSATPQQDTNHIPDESIQGALSSSPNQPDQTDTVIEPSSAIGHDPLAISGASSAPTSDDTWQHPGTPLNDSPAPISDVISPAGGFPRPMSSQLPVPGSTNDPSPSFSTSTADTPDSSDDTAHKLIDIKQHALEELEPLIDQLDQPPEEKFRTIMMMIQASDDQDLVPKAYEAAHSIEDEKARAQALLDIVNEINYFTQQPE